MYFSVICGFTLLLIVLCFQLDFTSSHLLQLSSSRDGGHLKAPVKKTKISGMIGLCQVSPCRLIFSPSHGCRRSSARET